MSIFQIVLILGVALSAFMVVRFLPGEKSLAVKRIFAIIFIVLSVLAIIFPNALTKVAHFVGIGRGTDLLLYIFIIASMIFNAAVIRAKARTDAKATQLARSIALLNTEVEELKASKER